MIAFIVLATVLATAILSGVLGMAGGMVLMVILVGVLPVAAAMVVHGAAQAASNGARVWFLRRHLMWDVLPPYVVGGTATTAVFSWVVFVPDPGLILILVGAFPWLARLTPLLRGLDIRNRATSLACGTTVTAVQLLAGASGPLLDAFYLNTDVDPRRIVATKAATQTIGHLVKIAYYGIVADQGATTLSAATSSATAPPALVGGAILLAIIGARIGTRLLNRLDANRFRRVTTVVVLTLGAACVFKGIGDLALS